MSELSDRRTARFMPTDALILNPHIGFTTFQRFNGDALNPLEHRTWTEGCPIEYQPFRGTLSNGDYPDTTVAYFRLYWKYFEPEDGRYRFDLIDRALETAKERGQTLMLRLPPYGPDRISDVPDWLRERNSAPKRQDLDFSRPEYDEFYVRYARAISELGRRYDHDPRLDSVDLSIIGPWGEGAGTDELSPERRDGIIAAYTEHFRHTPLMGFVVSPNAVMKANEARPVGFRADCLGDMGEEWRHMLDFYPRSIAQLGDLWKRAPVSFEVCWVVYHWLDMGWDIDYIIEQSLKWHISTFNAKSSAIPPEWKGSAERWLKRMGYRYCLRFFDYAARGKCGQKMDVGFWMENRGVAPCYHAYLPTLRFQGARACASAALNADPKSWLPGDTLWKGTITIPDALPDGVYDLQFGLVDPNTGEAAIQMPIDAAFDGKFARLGSVRIG